MGGTNSSKEVINGISINSEIPQMTNYREVMRLQNLGLNHSQIAASAEMSRPTVIKVLRLARAKGLDWRAVEDLSDRELGVSGRLKVNHYDGK